MATILCVDDEPAIGMILQDTLEKAGHRPIVRQNIPEALRTLSEERVDLIISDYRMPALTGLELLDLLDREGYDIPLIMITGYASIEHAVTAIKAGAVDYIVKPVRPDILRVAVDQALEFSRLRRENEELNREVLDLRRKQEVIGDSPGIQRLLQTVSNAAPTRATILLQGESGVGKEVFARAIHNRSDRAARTFIKLNCAALPEGIIESALFGHEKGAFTGAVKRVHGAFERADGGTLLLDEVSEMRPDLQAKLLRVLQEQEFERVGGDHPLQVDVRVIATTNRDLAGEVERGAFREDLYYRLSVIPLHIPPLRERREDIPLLAFRFAREAAAESGRNVEGISPDAIRMLQAYDWPGNVRELQHTIQRAVILGGENVLQKQSFDAMRFGLAVGDGPSAARTGSAAADAADDIDAGEDAVVLRTLDIAEAEEVLIRKALEKTGDNRTQAAALLGINVRTLRNKLNR